MSCCKCVPLLEKEKKRLALELANERMQIVTMEYARDEKEKEIDNLTLELEEQARLLGISGSREAALLAERDRLREVLLGIASYKGIQINSDRLADIVQSALDGGKA